MRLLRLPLTLLVLLYQSVVLAAGQVWANKLRSALTTVGIVIGVASVTAVIAALTGLKSNVLSEFESFGTNKIFINAYPPRDPGRRTFTHGVPPFRMHQFDGLIEHCPSVGAFTRVCEDQQMISFGPRSEPAVEVQGIEPAWHRIENRAVVLGRPFSLIDQDQARAVCLINDKVQVALGLERDPTGQAILIGGRRYTIVGVIETRNESSMFGNGGQGLEVHVPLNTMLQGRELWISGLAVSRSPDVSEEARAEITFFLRHQRRLKPGDPADFRVDAIEQFVREFKSVAAAITMVATGVVGISLLVGGVGIMNIMLVSVSERTREIGLRKAVGAGPSAILLQFLVEAVMLCFLGGAIGVVLGAMITRLLASFPQAKLQRAAIPPWAILLSFGFAAGVGLIFGMFPAIKAARLDPIEALRHE